MVTLKQFQAQIKEAADVLKQAGSLPKGFHFRGPYDFVAKFGQPFEWQPKPANCPDMAPKECWRNACLHALNHGLIYVEGLATRPGRCIPIHHAWCVEPNSRKVIDPTPSGREFRIFVGIPFTLDFVHQIVAETEHGFSNMFEDYQNEFILNQMSPAEIRKVIEVL